jgi:hypothetical protein
MEVVKKRAVSRAEKEHENRGAIRVLGSSIAGIIFLWGSSHSFWTEVNRANIGNELLGDAGHVRA